MPGPQVSTARPDDYLNVSSVLPVAFNRTVSRIVPGILTTLGILGTFIGLSKGVADLATGFGQSEIDQMRFGVLGLMQGLSTAFWTSIFGLTLALSWAGLDRATNKRAEHASHELCSLLGGWFPSISEDSGWCYSLQIAIEQKDTLKSLSTDIATKFLEGLEASLERIVLPGLSQMTETVERMATNSSEIQTEGIERLIEKFGDTLGERMRDQFDNLADTIENLCQWQRETKENLDQIITKLSQTTEKQDEMLTKSMEAATLFQNSLGELGAIHDRLSVVLASFDRLTGQTENLERSIAQAYEGMSANTKELSATLSKSMQEMAFRSQEYQRGINQQTEKIDALTRATMQPATTLDETLKTSMAKFNEDAARGIELTFSEFDKHLAALTRTMSGTIQEIEGTVRQIAERIQEVNDVSISLETTIKELNENAAKFADAINNLALGSVAAARG